MAARRKGRVKRGQGRFPSAAEDERQQKSAIRREPSPQTRSPTYRLAFADPEFLLEQELRPVRLQLELLKPELLLRRAGIETTVVVFGSSRIPEPGEARKALAVAEAALAEQPGDAARQRAVARARNVAGLSRYYEVARSFGRMIAAHVGAPGGPRYVVATGGGPGFMEAANRGAADAGEDTVGFSIVLPHEQRPNAFVTPSLSFNFHYFAIRKMHFLIRAAALVCFPGGFGTLDELFEALTLIQTRKIEPMPVLLFGEAWWRRMIDFDGLAEAGVIAPEDLGIFRFVETAEEGVRAILGFYGQG